MPLQFRHHISLFPLIAIIIIYEFLPPPITVFQLSFQITVSKHSLEAVLVKL